MRPVEGELLKAERAQAILGQLTPRQREAVLLVARGYTQGEVGAELGIKQAAVSRLIGRAECNILERNLA